MANRKTIDPMPQQSDGVLLVSTAAKKLGFHGSAPTVQRSGAAGAALGAATYAAPNAGALNSGDAGTDTVIASLRTQLAALAVDVAAMRTLVVELRAAAVEKGLHKGAA